MKDLIKTLLLAAALAGGACASAPTKPDAGVTVLGLGPKMPTAGREAQDAKVMEAAMAGYQQRGFAGLGPHLGALRTALDGAPAKYPAIEQTGEDHWVVRASDFDDGMLLTIAAAAAGKDGKSGVVEQVANVYPSIALMLGSEAVERKAYTEALGYLDRGLSMQPQHPTLLVEKSAALIGLGKLQEALALSDAAIASDDMLLSMRAAPFHRKRGFILVEMGRLDEAQAAYEQSLKLEPDSEIAKNELVYIRRLRSGAAKTPSVLVAPGAKGQQQ